MTLEEVEAIVEKLAKEGITTEKIGLILRDQYGIPTAKIFGKKLSAMLKGKPGYKDATFENAQKKFKRIKVHLEKHHGDKKSRRALEIRTARVRKLKKYVEKKEKKSI